MLVQGGLDWIFRSGAIKVLAIGLGTFCFSPNWGFLKKASPFGIHLV
jgi:hypothetical protein